MPKHFALLLLMILLISWSCSREEMTIDVDVSGSLDEHSLEFEKKVYQVTDNVYSAVGFGLANSVMIEGDEGIIIVDTMESNGAAREVLDEFRKISDKPVKAIIYTHNHTDHVMGALTMNEDGAADIYAHDTLDGNVQRIVNKMRPIIGSRSLRMFGNFLTEEEVENAGIGPFLSINEGDTVGYARPTITFSDRLEINIEGQEIVLIHAPGETDDQIYVHLPEQDVLICGDNYYKSFPNLYTIRGTTFRSLEQWYKSIDQIRHLKPAFLVPNHSRPMSGRDSIYEYMTNYRDAIQYVHDQGIRAINSGMTPDQIVANVILPDHLAGLPYLQEFYGQVDWSLRSLFAGNLGWFSGDSADLNPLSPIEQDKLMADLAGGEDKLLEKAKQYARDGNTQAALQLSGPLMRLNPDSEEARDLRVKALIELGSREENANARHYYLTEAKEVMTGEPVLETVKATPELLRQIPIEVIIKALPVSLKAEKTIDMNSATSIHFTDVDRSFTIYIRRGIAEIREELVQDAEIMVKADSIDFSSMLAEIKNPITTLAGFDYEKGNAVSFGAFLNLFGYPEQKVAYEAY